jgi:hypothetical protein
VGKAGLDEIAHVAEGGAVQDGPAVVVDAAKKGAVSDQRIYRPPPAVERGVVERGVASLPGGGGREGE